MPPVHHQLQIALYQIAAQEHLPQRLPPFTSSIGHQVLQIYTASKPPVLMSNSHGQPRPRRRSQSRCPPTCSYLASSRLVCGGGGDRKQTSVVTWGHRPL